ncbi:MAG: DoxX family protein [Bacteroidia bacterium]|nr:DoxX family protein [Bacteroidia bacterium]
MNKIKQFFFSTTEDSPMADLGLLILRVGAGLSLAFGHGLGKIPATEGFIEGVGKMGFAMPALFAWAAALSEFLGGIFIALGFATKPSSVLITITMLVAAFIRHAEDPFGRKEKAILFALIAIYLLLKGAGKYSLDELIYNRMM